MLDYHVIDVYPLIYSGEYGKYTGGKTVRNLPVSGIYKVLRMITAELSVNNSVVCCFDYFTNHSNKIEGYKSNRKKDPRVLIQADYLYDMLRDCGIPCYRGFGEADDHVFGICQSLVNDLSYGQSVIITSSDYDLCHNVDERGVVFKAANSNVNNVDAYNFSTILSDFAKEKEDLIMFNTISAYKACVKDKSDSIKPFTLSNGISGKDIYSAYVKFLKDNEVSNASITTNKELFVSFLKGFNFSEEDFNFLVKRVETTYPKDLSNHFEGGYKTVNADGIDATRLMEYCKALGDSTSISNCYKLANKHRLKININDERVDALTNSIFELGSSFKSGVYSADKSLPLNSLNVFTEKVSVRKGF